MDFGSQVIRVGILFLLTFVINVPFGYFRKREKRFSLKWFLYIHLPIPLIILMRVLSALDLRYIPVFVFAAVLGQVLGGRIDLH